MYSLKQIVVRPFYLFVSLSVCLFITQAYAQPSLGYIRINTDLHSFRGNPSWLLIVRDVDNGQSIPYLYDFTQGLNSWVALSYSPNYLIIASTLSIEIYNPRTNRYAKYKIHNFCHLESRGRIHRNTTLNIDITGKLTTNAHAVSCKINSY